MSSFGIGAGALLPRTTAKIDNCTIYDLAIVGLSSLSRRIRWITALLVVAS